MIRFGAMNNPGKIAIEEVLLVARQGFDFCDFTYEGPGAAILPVQATNMRYFITQQMGFPNFKFVGHTFFDLKYVTFFSQTFKGSLSAFKEAIGVLNCLDVPTVTIHFDSGSQFMDRSRRIEQHIKMLESLVKHTKSKKLPIQIVLENSPFGRKQASEFEDILLAVPEVGLHLDIAHALITGGMEEVDDFLALGENGRLKHVHISDNDGRSDQHLPVGVPHKTKHDWAEIINHLKSIGYGETGYGITITLEVHSDDHWNRIHSRDIIRELWENA